jgi:hypothetical protein
MEIIHVQVLPLKIYLDEGSENIVPDRLRTGTPNSRFCVTIKNISFKWYFKTKTHFHIILKGYVSYNS